MRSIFYIFIIVSNLIFSQTATTDTNTILIGDQIQLNISSEFEEHEKYNWPSFNDSVFEKVEIINLGNIDTVTKENSFILSQSLIITSFDSGTYYIPPFIFNENKKTKGILLSVNTILITDSSKMHDITSTKIGTDKDFTEEELAEIRKKRWRIFYWIFGILLLSILIYYLITKYKRDGTVLRKKQIIPSHIIALNKLQNLKKKKLWQKGEIKEYYSAISIILREYTENRFNFNALEMPTSDIMKILNRIEIKKSDTKILEIILKKSDNIKYAKGLSIEKENKETMEMSIKFIKNTKIEDVRKSK